MSLRRIIGLASVFLVLVIVGTAPTLQNNLENTSIPIRFEVPVNLRDDDSVRAIIISHLVNQDKGTDEPIKIINQETLESDYDISVELGAIREMNETSIDNRTALVRVRFFIASYVDFSKPNKETHLSGWIDEHRNVHVWDGVTIYWVKSSTHAPSMWIPFHDDDYCINKFIETTSDDGYEYWNVTVGPVEMSPEGSNTEGKKIRMFSANTKWGDNEVYWAYAGYITEDLEVYYTRLA
ncbi:hypothetical protein JXL21_00215 [Candidatus Bathyarchaeota archaeon]|nr:hypothetical protein [Candidatus Bathyarchaeota archaeon]